MNKRIKKKKWKQAAARSRADRLEEIRRFGEDNAIVVRHCFVHWAIFGEKLLGDDKLWEAYCAAVMIARAEEVADSGR